MTQLIPAVDLMDGKVVRLTKGDYDTRKDYHDDPLSMAKHFEDAGADRIHLVDLDAARKKGSNAKVIHSIAKETNLLVQMGGGIRDHVSAQSALDEGVTRLIIGSLAVKSPETVFEMIQKWGGEQIIIGTDVRNGFLATDGWLETSSTHIDDFITAYMAEGASIFLCTDIAMDGTLEGPSMELYKNCMSKHKGMKMIASGGVSSIDDIKAIQDLGMYGVVIGKAIYENRIKVEQLFQKQVN